MRISDWSSDVSSSDICQDSELDNVIPTGGTCGARARRRDKVAGLHFEQFTVGQKFVHEIRKTVTDLDNMLFCSLTYNPAAIHIDHEYAKSTQFGKPLMNSRSEEHTSELQSLMRISYADF